MGLKVGDIVTIVPGTQIPKRMNPLSTFVVENVGVPYRIPTGVLTSGTNTDGRVILEQSYTIIANVRVKYAKWKTSSWGTTYYFRADELMLVSDNGSNINSFFD